MTALSKNPDTRFARIEAFANALEQASHTEPTIPNSHISPSDAPTYMPPFAQIERPATPLPLAPLLPFNAFSEGIPATVAVTPGVIGQPAPQKEPGITRRSLLIGVGV